MSENIPKERRVYYYTSPDSRSPVYVEKLNQVVRENGLALRTDTDRNADGTRSETFGLRYSVDREHPQLREFRDPEGKAYVAWKEGQRSLEARRDHVRNVAANSVAADATREPHPLYLPKPPNDEKDPDYQKRMAAFTTATNGIRKIPTERLKVLIEITANKVTELKSQEDMKVASGGWQSEDERRQHLAVYYRHRRGLQFAQHVIKERGRSPVEARQDVDNMLSMADAGRAKRSSGAENTR